MKKRPTLIQSRAARRLVICARCSSRRRGSCFLPGVHRESAIRCLPSSVRTWDCSQSRWVCHLDRSLGRRHSRLRGCRRKSTSHMGLAPFGTPNSRRFRRRRCRARIRRAQAAPRRSPAPGAGLSGSSIALPGSDLDFRRIRCCTPRSRGSDPPGSPGESDRCCPKSGGSYPHTHRFCRALAWCLPAYSVWLPRCSGHSQ